MFPSGSVAYTKVIVPAPGISVETSSPSRPPPAATTASRAEATSSTIKAIWAKPGRLMALLEGNVKMKMEGKEPSVKSFTEKRNIDSNEK